MKISFEIGVDLGLFIHTNKTKRSPTFASVTAEGFTMYTASNSADRVV